ncbi:MAG TPA: type II toxin-antitoxin system VapC family toxin [Thermodesulfobacteriota bacterium]|nr:type II toxin-antitoxin system VapC family toxin [Thermodesulfobacteriota bacterium]
MTKSYLFDAFPLLCWLQEEPGHEKVDQLLSEAEDGRCLISLQTMNLGEVFYRVGRIAGLKLAEEILERIRLLPIRVLLVTDEDIMEAAKIKARYSISYADAFAVAKAIQTGVTVVTGDPEYKAVAKLINVLWVK